MKRVKLINNVLDNMFNKPLELMTNSFGSENIQHNEVFEISSWQKETVLKRVEAYKKNPSSALDFEQVMTDFEKKHIGI